MPDTASQSASDTAPDTRTGLWTNHGTLKTVYSNWWLTLNVDKVEKPDGSIVEHEVVIGPDAAGMVVMNDADGMLMIWRHRFMPDTWGWEIPGGAVDPGEEPRITAERECLEETGWAVTGQSRHLSRHHPSCGLVRQTFDLYLTENAEYRGDPVDKNEAACVAWRSLSDVSADMSNGMISDGLTQLAVSLAFARTGRGDLLADPHRDSRSKQ